MQTAAYLKHCNRVNSQRSGGGLELSVTRVHLTSVLCLHPRVNPTRGSHSCGEY